MKTRIIILINLLLVFETVWSIPANPNPFTLTQPDNSSFEARQIGDESGAHFETLEGYTIVKNETNWWHYAIKDERGKLISAGYRVGITDPQTLGLQRHLHSTVTTPELVSVVGATTGSHIFKSSRISAPVLAPQTGTKKVLVILINFTDAGQNAGDTPSYYENLLFNASAGANSMNNYYKEVSYNKMNITGTIAGNRWFSASKNLAWYGADVTDIDENTTHSDPNNWYIFKLAKEAVIAADPYVNYSQYDTDGDGVIDHLIIVHAGNGQESSGVSNDIWSHRWDIYTWTGSTWSLGYTTNDGVKAVGYTMQAETSPHGTFSHEFGHDLGLPDLYDTDDTSYGIGDWDIMAVGSWLNSGNTPAHFSAWSKYFLGWVTPTKITASLFNEQISQSETSDDVYMLLDNPGDTAGNLNWNRNGAGTGEYFLVENRRKVGYDAYLPGEGLLIWHIDETRGNNTNESHKLVALEEADGLNHLDSKTNHGDANDSWYNSAIGFTEATAPNSNFYNGSGSGVRVTGISTSASIMIANLIVGWPPPTLTHVFPTPANNSKLSRKYVFVNISSNEALSVALLDWNGTNYTMSSLSQSSWYKNMTNLADGIYVYRVYGNDSTGNWNTSESRVITIDTSPPIITIFSPTNSTIGDNMLLLNVTFGEVVNASWYNNETTNSSPVYGVSNLTLNLPIFNDGPHRVMVYANDSLGNLNSSSVYFTIDTTPPSISVVNLSSVERGFSANLIINITEPQPDTYIVYKNGSPASNGSYSNGVPFNISIDTSQLTMWNYTIWANDTAGNSNYTSVFTVVQDTTPPAITIHSPANASINDNIPLLNTTFDEVVNYTWYNVNGTVNSTPIGDTRNLTLFLDVLPDGRHNVTVYANDSLGNVNFSTRYFIVDTTPPTISVVSPLNKTYATTNITLNVSANEAVDVWRYSHNGTSNITFTPPTTIAVSEGANNIAFWANDTAGNLNYSIVYFTVDVTPPSVSNLTIAPRIPEVGALTNITVNATDAITSIQSVRANVTYPNGTTITLAMQPDSVYRYDGFNASIFGRYNVTILANDSAGNINSTVNTSFSTVYLRTNSSNLTNGTTATIINISNHLELLVTANESLNTTISMNALVSLTADIFGAYEINASNSPLPKPVKYVNATNITVMENITRITLRVYYNSSEILGLNEDSLALLYWNGSEWLRVAAYIDSRIPGGPNVTAAGLDKSNKFVYAELNRLSVYGIGGNVQSQQQQQSISGGGGGGGGGGAASVVVEGFSVASASFMVDVVKELNLLYKQFYVVDRVLASVMAFTGEATGEYPAPVDHARWGLKKPVARLVGDVYELAAKQVLKKWVVARGVVIARGDLEVDGMAAVAYAKARGMPILLTKSGELPSATLDAIRRLGAKEIVIAGGPVAVSDGVEDGLAGVGSVSRIWGRNREETAVELAKGMEKTTVIKTIVVADGSNAGIEAAIIAASYRAPIVYAAGDNVPAVTKDFLADHKRAKDAYANKMKVVFVGVSDKAKAEIEALMG